MRLGLALPHYDFSLTGRRPISFEDVAEYAVLAEELGFDSVWVSDHLFWSIARYGGSGVPQGTLEPMTTLPALATRTPRVRLGTLVLCAPLQPPSLLAKMSAALGLALVGRRGLGA